MIFVAQVTDGCGRDGTEKETSAASPKSTLLVGFEADEMGWVM